MLKLLADQSPLPPQVTGSSNIVSPKGPIQVTFDRPMDKPATEAAWSVVAPDGKPVAGSLSWSAARTLLFTPSQPLQNGAVYLADAQRYLVITWYYPAGGGKMSGAVLLRHSEPVERLATRLIWPPERRLYLKNHGSDAKPTAARKDDLTVYTWDYKKVPGLRTQPQFVKALALLTPEQQKGYNLFYLDAPKVLTTLGTVALPMIQMQAGMDDATKKAIAALPQPAG